MSDFSLAPVIQQLPQSSLKLHRPSEGAIVRGFRQPTGEALGLKFSAHVQPTTPRELSHIPGGENIESAITVYTNTELKTADETLGHEADRIEYRGRTYKVVSVADWIGQGFRTFICGEVAVRVPA